MIFSLDISLLISQDNKMINLLKQKLQQAKPFSASINNCNQVLEYI